MIILKCKVCKKLAPLEKQKEYYQKLYKEHEANAKALQLPEISSEYFFCWGGGEDTYYKEKKENTINPENDLSYKLTYSLVGFNGSSNCDKSNVNSFLEGYIKRKKQIIQNTKHIGKKIVEDSYLEELKANEDKVIKFVEKLLKQSSWKNQ